MSEGAAPSTADRLADELAAIGCPPEMVTVTRFGYYDDFRSPLAMPLAQLVADLGVLARSRDVTAEAREKITGLAERVKAGEFDGTPAEADAWGRSPEGLETLADFANLGMPPQPALPAPRGRARGCGHDRAAGRARHPGAAPARSGPGAGRVGPRFAGVVLADRAGVLARRALPGGGGHGRGPFRGVCGQ
jgi:hypothetical protein